MKAVFDVGVLHCLSKEHVGVTAAVLCDNNQIVQEMDWSHCASHWQKVEVGQSGQQ